MKSTLLSLLLIVIGSSAFAQGAAPYWEPLSGPPGATLEPIFNQQPDSTITRTVGGAEYIYLPDSNKWVHKNSEGGNSSQVNKGRFSFLSKDWIPGRYGSNNDTLFFSSDSGKNWRIVGTFGTPGIRDFTETSSHHVLVADSSNRLFVTSDTFATIDTQRVPELAHGFICDEDTVYLYTVHGNLFRSTDFGRSWRMVFDLHDTNTNWFSQIARKGNIWILAGAQVRFVFPAGFTNLFFIYSFDRGKSWTVMPTTPFNNVYWEIAGIDNDGIVYVYFSKGLGAVYRTEDWGKTWHKLPIPTDVSGNISSLLVHSTGTLYYPGNLFSTDHGETWDTVSNGADVVVCLPTAMLSFGDSTMVTSTSRTLGYTSADAGQSWTQDYYLSTNPGDPLQLSLRPDSTQWPMLNTTQMQLPSGGRSFLCPYSYVPTWGIGTITSGFHVWLVGSRLSGFYARDTVGSLHLIYVMKSYLSESTDRGCSYYTFDTLSSTPIVQVMESANDTILAVSTSGVYRGVDAFLPFDTVTPERGTGATPTGAMIRDSTGAIYVAMSDGKIFQTTDGAKSWHPSSSPVTDASSQVQHLAAGPAGFLFAVDSNRTTGLTSTMIYDPAKGFWRDVTTSLTRQNFSGPAVVTYIWYIHNYVWAGTWNMGLFRSLRPVVATQGVPQQAGSTARAELYPNPAESLVTVSNPTGVSGWLTVVDVTGRTWQRIAIAGGSTETQLNVESLPAGVYCVRITLGDVRTVKLVKN